MLSLANLRARDVPIQWHEAVAIVQELATMADGSGHSGAVPDLEDVILLGDGAVQSRPGRASSDHPVKQLARLLQTLIEGTQAPPELRLLVGEATLATPRYETPQEFARALSFFERPSRRADIAHLVARGAEPHGQEAASKPEGQGRKSLEALDRMLSAFPVEATRTEGDHPEDASPPRGNVRRRARWLIAAAVILLAASGLLVWYLTGAGRTAPADARSLIASTLASTPLPGLYVEARTLVGRFWDRFGGLSEPDASEAAPAVATPPASTVASAAGSPQRPAPSGSDGSTPSAPSLASRPVVPPAFPGIRPVPAAPASPGPGESGAIAAGLAEPPPGESARSPSAPQRPPAAAAPFAWAADPRAAGAPVYTQADTDVVPAALLHPKLPSEWPAGLDPDEAGVLEILVSETGAVEQVRLRSPASRYRERMLLAAAKAWRFLPALKDGEPVRYLLEIPITL